IGQPGRRGRLDRKAAIARLREIEAQFGSHLDPYQPVSELAVGEQQRLEIIKALFRGARILILDEPTAVLTPDETDSLFRALTAMTADGIGIILITHQLKETYAIANRVLVVRSGQVAGGVDDMSQQSESDLVHMMCGREVTAPTRLPSTVGQPLLA